MIYLFDIESENLPDLLKLYYSIAEVVQVRCNRVIRQHYIDHVGTEGLYITCMVKAKGQGDKFLKFETALPRSVWDNPDEYQNCLQAMKRRIDDYIYNDILPKQPYGEE